MFGSSLCLQQRSSNLIEEFKHYINTCISGVKFGKLSTQKMLNGGLNVRTAVDILYSPRPAFICILLMRGDSGPPIRTADELLTVRRISKCSYYQKMSRDYMKSLAIPIGYYFIVFRQLGNDSVNRVINLARIIRGNIRRHVEKQIFLTKISQKFHKNFIKFHIIS